MRANHCQHLSVPRFQEQLLGRWRGSARQEEVCGPYSRQSAPTVLLSHARMARVGIIEILQQGYRKSAGACSFGASTPLDPCAALEGQVFTVTRLLEAWASGQRRRLQRLLRLRTPVHFGLQSFHVGLKTVPLCPLVLDDAPDPLVVLIEVDPAVGVVALVREAPLPLA